MADVKDASRRIVFTGASGGIGTMIRPLLAPLYPGLVLSDKVEPKNLLRKFSKARRSFATWHELTGAGLPVLVADGD